MNQHKQVALIIAHAAATLCLGQDTKTACSEEELKLPLCHHAITNNSCKVMVAREGPVAPLPIRLKPKARTCIVINKLASESIVFEAEYKDSAPQDPFVAIAGAFVPTLKTFVASVSATNFSTSSPLFATADPRYFDRKYDVIEARIARLMAAQQKLKEAATAARTRMAAVEKLVGTLKKSDDSVQYAKHYNELCGEGPCVVSIDLPTLRLVEQELKSLGEEIGKLHTETLTEVKRSAPHVEGLNDIESLDDTKREIALTNLSAPATKALSQMNRILAGFADADDNQRRLQAFVQTLEKSRTVIDDTLTILPRPADAKWTASYVVRSTVDDQNITSLGVNRGVSLKLSAQDLVSKEKKLLTTVAATWGSTRWELSTGLLLSNLTGRSFANTIQFADGLPVANRFRVTESKTIPTVVPAALVHYRLRETGARHRIALLATGAAGVNTASTTADFGGGFSVSWRSLVLSFLVHGTRDLGLSNGYSVGMELPTATPAPTTERRWVAKGAVGISYRIPVP